MWNGDTHYPPPAFAFAVAIIGERAEELDTTDAGFREASGIDPHVDVEEIAEGGVNSHVHRVPGVTKHGTLMLKRGFVTKASPFARWAGQTVGSTLGTPIVTRSVTLSLLGPGAQPVVTWTFANAWPVKWEVGGFDATRNEVLTEALEITYATVTRTSG
jgi:phage tail-like protein